MATATKRTNVDINIPLESYSTAFDKENEALKFSNLIGIPRVSMEFYLDEREGAQYLLAITIPANGVAKSSAEDEKKPEFNDTSVERDFRRYAKNLVEKSAYLIQSRKFDIDMEMV